MLPGLRRRAGRAASIGIDVGTGFVKTAVADHSGGQPEIVALDLHRLPSNGITGQGLRTMIGGALRLVPPRPFVVAAVGGPGVAVRRLRLQRAASGALREVVRWEADRWMPPEFDEETLDRFTFGAWAPRPGTDGFEAREPYVLAAASRTELVEARQNLLAEAGLAPNVIETTATALHNAVSRAHDAFTQGGAAVLDLGRSHSCVSVSQEGDLVASEPCGVTAQEAFENPNEAAERAAAALDGAIIHLGGSLTIGEIFLAGGGAGAGDFASELSVRSGAETTLVNPLFGWRLAPEAKVEFDLGKRAPQLAVAVGLALRSGRVP